MRRHLMALTTLILAQGTVMADEVADTLEPEVVITPRDNSQVKEYRVNGRLYMIEITPAKGPRYFLVDSDGDGTLERRQSGPLLGVEIPRWTLLEW